MGVDTSNPTYASVVSLRQLDRILRLDPGDGVIVVESGATVEAIREATTTIGLWCPALRWLPARTTIGAAVAGGHGKRSRSHGSVADHVLGMTFVCPSVGLVKHGGAAIKNATGYNLGAIVAGSRGNFGVILEVTLRLIPLPPFRQVAALHFGDDEALRLAAGSLPLEKPIANLGGTTFLANAVGVRRGTDSPGGAIVVEVEGIVETRVAARLQELIELGEWLGGSLVNEEPIDGRPAGAGTVVFRSSMDRRQVDPVLRHLAQLIGSDPVIRIDLEGTGGGIAVASECTDATLLRSRARGLGLPTPASPVSPVWTTLKSAFDPDNLLRSQPLLLLSND